VATPVTELETSSIQQPPFHSIAAYPGCQKATGACYFNDAKVIRRTAVAYRVPCITTLSGAKAAAEAVASRRYDPVRVWSLQEIHAPVG
jgi:hypothetical protein